jgi:hypothetical protein
MLKVRRLESQINTFIRYTQSQNIGSQINNFIRYAQSQKIGSQINTFIRYPQSQKIGKSNNLKVFGNKKTTAINRIDKGQQRSPYNL